jgi:hypothetical protein
VNFAIREDLSVHDQIICGGDDEAIIARLRRDIFTRLPDAFPIGQQEFKGRAQAGSYDSYLSAGGQQLLSFAVRHFAAAHQQAGLAIHFDEKRQVDGAGIHTEIE